MLILTGDEDSKVSLSACQRQVTSSASAKALMSLRVFPGATHFFDNPNYAKGAQAKKGSMPLWYADNHYDEAAHREALAEVRRFLKKHLE